jgi:hypothetical protein
LHHLREKEKPRRRRGAPQISAIPSPNIVTAVTAAHRNLSHPSSVNGSMSVFSWLLSAMIASGVLLLGFGETTRRASAFRDGLIVVACSRTETAFSAPFAPTECRPLEMAYSYTF